MKRFNYEGLWQCEWQSARRLGRIVTVNIGSDEYRCGAAKD
jgi:hypothetical protein